MGWTWALWALAFSGLGFGLGPHLYFMSSFNFEKTRRKNIKCEGGCPLPPLIKASFIWFSSTRITLVTEDNLKSIQAESYSIHFDQSQTLSNLCSLKNSTTLKKNLSKILKSQICFSEYIQRCSLLSNLNKLLNCIKRLVKAFNDWSVSS